MENNAVTGNADIDIIKFVNGVAGFVPSTAALVVDPTLTNPAVLRSLRSS